jgi:small subunit ribosomal protein S4
MGQPKLRKRTYSTPTHPWQKERIEEEKALLNEFGLKNKEEIWKVGSKLRKYARQAKTLIALNTPQAEIEITQLVSKLKALGLIGETAKLEDVLTITLKDILNRRLQTILYKKKLAKSIRQARQFIIHHHVFIGDKKITSPAYLVSKNEEPQVNFAPNSPFIVADHPERVVEKEAADKPKAEEKKTRKKPERNTRRRQGRYTKQK